MTEPPTKRPRLGSYLGHDDDVDDELFFNPTQVNAQRDPAVLLEQSRAVASFKLKSRWEDVIARFEKDFSGEDDIINFYTDELPEVEVDNGHLRSLEDVDDAKSADGSDAADLDEEERILQGTGGVHGQVMRAAASSLVSRPMYGGRLSGLGSLAPGPPRFMSTMFTAGAKFQPFTPFGPLRSFNQVIDPLWSVPELPPDAFKNHGIATAAVRRRVTLKALPAPEDDGSDEDDILMGRATQWPKKQTDAAPRHDPDRTAKNVSGETASRPCPEAEKRVVAQNQRVQLHRKKRGRPRQIVQRDSAPVEAETVEETTPATEPQEEDLGQPDRRKLRGPKAKRQNSSLGMASGDSENAVPGTPPSLSKSAKSRITAGQTERRKRGRPRKLPGVTLLGGDTSATARNLAVIEPDLNVSLQSSLVIPSSVEPLESSGSETSSAKFSHRRTKPGVRIEVQLFRRRCPPTVGLQESSKTSLVIRDGQSNKNGLHDRSDMGEKNSSVTRSKRKVSLSSVPAVRENQPDGSRSQIVPAHQNVQSALTAKVPGIPACPVEINADSELQRAPASRPDQSRLPHDPSTDLAAPKEHVLRNTIDQAYAFSDEEEGFAPRSRAKRGTTQNKVPSSRSKRASTTQARVGRASLLSSPSERVGLTAVDQAVRSSSRGPTSTQAQQPERADTMSDKTCHAPLESTTVAEGSDINAEKRRENSIPNIDKTVDAQITAVHLGAGMDWSQNRTIPTTPTPRQSLLKPSHTESVAHPSTSKRSILSLLPDSDEDELSLWLDQISPIVGRVRAHHPTMTVKSRSTVKKPYMKRISLGPHGKVTPLRQHSRVSGGWKSASTASMTARMRDVFAEEELHRTPGGTMRRCGKDGFKCERDFCFVCL
jgi:hypothetical protein